MVSEVKYWSRNPIPSIFKLCDTATEVDLSDPFLSHPQDINQLSRLL